MTTAHLRMARYYLVYARQHKDDWQALDGVRSSSKSGAGGRWRAKAAQG